MTTTTSVRFAAPWCNTLKVTSTFVVLLLGMAAAAAVFSPGTGWVGRWIGLAVVPVGVLLAALFVVREYALVPGELRVRRLLWQTRIPLWNLVRAEADPRSLSPSLRLAGNGGFFSFTGWYYNRRLGRYRMLVNDPSRAVVLHFADRRPLAVSPADPAGFVRAVTAQVGRAPG